MPFSKTLFFSEELLITEWHTNQKKLTSGGGKSIHQIFLANDGNVPTTAWGGSRVSTHVGHALFIGRADSTKSVSFSWEGKNGCLHLTKRETVFDKSYMKKWVRKYKLTISFCNSLSPFNPRGTI